MWLALFNRLCGIVPRVNDALGDELKRFHTVDPYADVCFRHAHRNSLVNFNDGFLDAVMVAGIAEVFNRSFDGNFHGFFL